ncbi:phosphotransferase family protein [Nocardioides humilatus]|uniref:Phosphotransferase family protein n=1 Tax=Nocardioides humilatus TaxID=2607660 RepID=A0A5B1LMY7_9ACTN|nr:choline/ethanolamine kinase family protein [Nocardioides humilatus]KAA1421846.1 phosphotransferase family protein [Nocardioides humilatus]
MTWRDIVDQIAWLRATTYEVEELTGGLTNVNLKVTHPGGTCVVRVAQPGSELLAIDRDHEHHNSVAAATAGVGAGVIDYLPDAGLMVVEYVDGRTFTDDDLRSGDHLGRVAAAVRQLHGGPRFEGDFDMFTLQPTYLSIVTERGFRLPHRYLDFAPQVERIRRAFAVRAEPTVPCNNDLLAGNLIDDGAKIWLIDYEYSGNNEATFELGNLWSEAGLTLDQLEELMAAYDGAVHRHRVARARLWGLMAKYGWTLWGSIQDSVSTFDFDFWGWAMEKYDRAVAEFDGPDFDRLLDEAAGDA